MDVIIADNELSIRLGFFVSLFVVIAVAEIRFPRRPLKVSRLQRWGNNLGLSFFNSALMKLVFPIAGTGLAVIAEEKQFGLLHLLSIVLSLMIKLGLVLVMGPQVIAVLVSEILLNLTSMFNHSNVRLPSRVDQKGVC